jgi:hypothetical protein
MKHRLLTMAVPSGSAMTFVTAANAHADIGVYFGAAPVCEPPAVVYVPAPPPPPVICQPGASLRESARRIRRLLASRSRLGSWQGTRLARRLTSRRPLKEAGDLFSHLREGSKNRWITMDMIGFDHVIQQYLLSYLATQMLFEKIMIVLASYDIFKSLLPVTILWCARFSKERTQWKREMVVASLASGLTSLILGRALAHYLPFRVRPDIQRRLHLTFPMSNVPGDALRF